MGRARIYVSGYSASVREVPDSEKAEVYARYHVGPGIHFHSLARAVARFPSYHLHRPC